MSGASVKLMENQAIVTTDLTKWFGEGESKMTPVNSVGLVAHFGEMLLIISPSPQPRHYSLCIRDHQYYLIT